MMDFNKYFKRRIIDTPLQKMSLKEHFVFWISKVLYAFFYIFIPVYFVGWGPWAVGFAIMHVAMGFTLAIVFQLAHVVEQVEFEIAKIDPKSRSAIFVIRDSLEQGILYRDISDSSRTPPIPRAPDCERCS